MNLDKWIQSAPLDEVKEELAKAQEAARFLNDKVIFLSTVVRQCTFAAQKEVVEEPKPKKARKCLGDFKVFDPDTVKCNNCADITACATECAKEVSSS